MRQPTSTIPATSVRPRGFTLVELMVAVTLGLLLTAGMIQMFSATKVTFNSNEALSRVQENGRFAMETLKRELRPTGARGFCAGRIEIENHLNQDCAEFPSDIFAGDVGLTGWEYSGTGRGDTYNVPESLDPAGASAADWSSHDGSNLPTVLEDRVVPGSDVIVIRRMTPSAITVDEEKSHNQMGLSSVDDCGSENCRNPEAGDLILITNCASGADLFQQSKSRTVNTGNGLRRPNMNCSAAGPGNHPPGPNDWGTDYDESAQVMFVSQLAYYIGFAGGDRNEPGLYQLDLARNQPRELAEGVENMQVLYGFSNDDDSGGDGQSVDAWLTADEVPEDGFQQVIAVRLSLLMRSPEHADTDRTDQSFALFDEDNRISMTLNTTGDGRIRHPFSTAVALRNQQLVID